MSDLNALIFSGRYLICCVFCSVSVKGKQVIHPGQVQAVQEEFSPSPERVQWAKELIFAFEQHQKEGKVKLINHYV